MHHLIGFGEARDLACRGLARRQLERLFKQHLDALPSRYYADLRLQRARRLLQHSGQSILQIGLACGFAHSYLLDRGERWWAIIPGGFMLALGGVLALSTRVEQVELLAAVLFFSLGATFFLLYWLDQRRRQWWALIPGSVLVIFGALVLTPSQESDLPLLRWWPVTLILIGLLVAFRSQRRRPVERLEMHAAPGTTTRRKHAGAPASAALPAQPRLGDYTQPAPGATVEVLPDIED